MGKNTDMLYTSGVLCNRKFYVVQHVNIKMLYVCSEVV